MRIVLLADLHGNWPATVAMERALDSLRADKIWFLGDAVGKGPASRACCDWVRTHCDAFVGGNWDYGIGGKEFPEDGYYWDQLGPERMKWLRELPREAEMTFAGLRFRLFHGRPVTELLRAQSSKAELEATFTTERGAFDGVIFADSHRPFIRTLSTGYICNCGSVGNSLGVPRAHCLLLEDEPLRLTVVSVPYDNEAAAEDARRDPALPHRDSWITEVLTGVYSR